LGGFRTPAPIPHDAQREGPASETLTLAEVPTRLHEFDQKHKEATTTSNESLFFFEKGAGPPLVLVHGLMIDGEMFATVLDRLAERRRVIVPDLRGSGRSRRLPPPDTVVRQSADLATLLDRLGIASADVLGYSQGGAVAQQFAADYPHRCSRLVLACAYAYNMATRREWLEGHFAPLLLRLLGISRFSDLVVGQGLKQVSSDRAAWVKSLIARQDKRRMIGAWKAAMAFDGRSRLDAIRCPTLIVAGSADGAVPMHHARLLHAGISSSRLLVIEGADHALVWSRPEALVDAVEEFLGT
jgi:pimeloyl-ACP methyl ester carboxylesterase